ncbi:MAG TPA: hypothetical protein VK912_02850 [Longimicrobiales bacterium]|nr:hypothetical protein [Longimicrobiales bacterium]
MDISEVASGPVAADDPLHFPPHPGEIPPPIPDSLAATGLTAGFVEDLLLKALQVRGAATGAELAEVIRLPFIIVEDLLLELVQRHWVEVRGGGTVSRANYVFELTTAGEQRAVMELATSRYVGPAPITLEHYRAMVALQSVHEVHLSQQRIRDGFSPLVLSSAFLDRLGPAINSARSLFLHGAAGNGKSLIASTIAALLGEPIYVPHAVLVEGQIMMIYDPASHIEPDEEETDDPSSSIWRSAAAFDERFMRVRRPVVATGGELTLDQLEMNFDSTSRLYQAPVQVKANGGVLILDDFGRQRVPSRELLNRWMVPLEQRRDLLALHTGTRFPVPFDCLLIFATNLDPSQLVEEAFLRRIRYKIFVDGPSREQYEEIFRRACASRNVPFDSDAVRYIYSRFYEQSDIEPRACHPRDIVDHVTDVARYLGVAPALTPELIDRACESYFLNAIGTTTAHTATR